MKNAFVPVHLSPEEVTIWASANALTPDVFAKSMSCATLPVLGLLYEYSGVVAFLGGFGVQAQCNGSIPKMAYRKTLESLAVRVNKNETPGVILFGKFVPFCMLSRCGLCGFGCLDKRNRP